MTIYSTVFTIREPMTSEDIYMISVRLAAVTMQKIQQEQA
jgi:hypothetical protein